MIRNILFAFLLIASGLHCFAATKSLQADNWKNSLLTKTWTPSGTQGVLVTTQSVSGDMTAVASGDYSMFTLSNSGVTAGSYAGAVTVNAKGIVTAAAASLDLTTGVTGVLPTANGGTGDSAPWYITAALDGGSPSLGTSAVASYTELTDGAMTLRPRSGSVAVGVMCSTTNAATAPSTGNTTCAAGSESVGINFTIPDANSAYEVCFMGTYVCDSDSGEGCHAAFQLIETPTNAQTLTLESGNILQVGNNAETIATGTSSRTYDGVNICAIFKWASVGTKGIRLMYEQSVNGGTLNISGFLADLAAGDGQRNMSWNVKKVH